MIDTKFIRVKGKEEGEEAREWRWEGKGMLTELYRYPFLA
jgi:hypothetical protein